MRSPSATTSNQPGFRAALTALQIVALVIVATWNCATLFGAPSADASRALSDSYASAGLCLAAVTARRNLAEATQ